MNKQEALFDLTLRLGDNSLIFGHRLSELCSKGPFLEEDIATTNIALDLVGQSRILLSYAGQVEGKGRSEDDLAYFRSAPQFRCALIAQLPNGDFAYTNAKLYFYSVYASLFLSALMKSKDETLAGFAGKAIKETAYHVRHTSEWLLRFGDGTEESHNRLQKAVDDIWMYTADMFATTEGDKLLIADGIIPDLAAMKSEWYKIVSAHLKTATINVPAEDAWQQHGSREGKHLEALTYILGEMQVVARAHPGASW